MKAKKIDLSIQCFGNTVRDSHSVIFGVNIRRNDQIRIINCDNIIIQVAKHCNSNKWYEASSSELLK